MLRGNRVVLWVILGVVATLLAFNGFVSAVGLSDEIRSNAETTGVVNLQMQIEPAVVRPGESVTLRITAQNRGLINELPIVDVVYPANLSSQLTKLPTSTTFNFKQHNFRWQPVIPAGETRIFEMPLRVDTAIVAQPIQSIVATSVAGKRLSAEFWTGTLPSVDILSVDEVSVGQPLQVRADIEGAGPFAQKWDLGDGRTFRADNPPISFATAGDHLLTLEVENPLGTVFARKSITVVPEPIALYSLDDPTPSVNQPIKFINQSGGEPPLTYRWEFSDGKTAFVREPLHHFTETGQHTITLTVENAHGISKTDMLVTVGEPPELGMSLPNEAEVGEQVIARALGEESIDSFTWQMGNGQRVVGDAISFVYTRPGLYTVTVSAENDFGITTLAQPVQVAPGILSHYLPVVFSQYDAAYASQMAAEAEADIPDFLRDFTPIDLMENVAPLDSTQEERLLWYINKAREAVELPPLEHVAVLSIAAKRHTNDMAFNRFWGHTGSDGTHPVERQEAAGYVGGYGGEATAWGFEFPSRAVQFWLDSPSHRPLILNPLVDQVGVAFTYDDTAPSVYYWTAEFGSTDLNYALPTAPRPTATPVEIQPTAVPQPTQPFVPQPTEPIIVARPTEAPIFERPTSTPNIIIVTPTPLPVEPMATSTDVPPTATPIILVATPTLLPTATQEVQRTVPTDEPTIEPTDKPVQLTLESTATPTLEPITAETETPTALPPTVEATLTPTETAEPTAIVVTSTPVVTATPEETPTRVPTPRPTDPPLQLATPIPSPEPTADASESASRLVTDEVEAVAAQFLEALIADAKGIQALPFATYGIQALLLNGGNQAALQTEADVTAFTLRGSWSEGAKMLVSADLLLKDDTTVLRTLVFVSADQWRVDAVSQ